MFPRERFCWECYNFEDRGNIDESALCAKGHRPGISCDDYIPKYGDSPEVTLHTKFCSECQNFEDRRRIDGPVLCAKGHRPGISCDDYIEKCCYYGCCSSCDIFVQDMKRSGK